MYRSRPRARRAVGLVTVLILAVTACGSDDDTASDDSAGDTSVSTDAVPSEGSSVSPAASSSESAAADLPGTTPSEADKCTEERKGGSLRVGVNQVIGGLSPATTTGTGGHGHMYGTAFYDTLMAYDALTGTVSPNVAESLEPNEDFTEWTLTLRPGVTFGNGDPLTASDVAAQFESLKTIPYRAAAIVKAAIVDTEVVDDLTIVFNMGEPLGGFPALLATEIGWVPNSRLVEERGDDFGADPTGAGVGPYEFESFSPGEDLVLSAKDDYWGGPVCITTLSFRTLPLDTALYEAFQQGEMDVVHISDGPVGQQALENGDMYLDYVEYVGLAGFFVFDQGRIDPDSPFKDSRVREAMQLAVDYDVVSERIEDGIGVTTSAMFPELAPLASVSGPPYDPERARTLVEDLKTEGAWDGKVTITYNLDHSFQPDMVILYEAMWEAVGIDVTLEGLAFADWLDHMIINPDYEVGTFALGAAGPTPWRYLQTLLGEASNFDGSSPAMKEALAELRAANTQEAEREALASVQEIWNAEFPMIMYSSQIWGAAIADNVHNVVIGIDTTPIFASAWMD